MTDAIEIVASGNIAVAGGGGGVPVTLDAAGAYEGVEAVIDKDLTSSVLATDIGADLLVILTAVDAVYLDWGTPQSRRLGAVTMAECERHVADHTFPPGSMGPKVQAAVHFVEFGTEKAIITSTERILDALAEKTGTHIYL